MPKPKAEKLTCDPHTPIVVEYRERRDLLNDELIMVARRAWCPNCGLTITLGEDIDKQLEQL